MTELDPLLEEVQEMRRINQQPPDADIGWYGENEEITKLCSAAEAVLAIPRKEDAYCPGSNVDQNTGYNLALSVVRAAIAEALGVEE